MCCVLCGGWVYERGREGVREEEYEYVIEGRGKRLKFNFLWYSLSVLVFTLVVWLVIGVLPW